MTICLKRGVGLAALTIPAVLREAVDAADAAHPTVVELFQSQGCSDCPPAAANVAAISDRPDVLALSFAVDYWDRLGGKDTFSKPAWTARQYAYAHAMAAGRAAPRDQRHQHLAGYLRRRRPLKSDTAYGLRSASCML